MVESENALLDSIKRKGEHSYYYAHAPRSTSDLDSAKVLRGEGIVTGGPPQLLGRQNPQNARGPKTETPSYYWSDEDETISVCVKLPEPLLGEAVSCEFDSRSFEFAYTPDETTHYKLHLKKLANPILPEESKFKVRRNKVVITLKKEETKKWWKLVDN